MKQFSIPDLFKSELVSGVKAQRRKQDRMRQDMRPYVFDFGFIRFYLPRDFGFCYGVEQAVEIIYKALAKHPNKRIFVLSELIHNPQVNHNLRARGVDFLQSTLGEELIPLSELRAEDVVIIPAFGTDIHTEKLLQNLDIELIRYDTTCPFVKKVWKATTKLGEQEYTIIIHGKHYHEESRATFSRACLNNQPCLMIKDLAEAELLAKYIRQELPEEQFFQDFHDKHSPNFDPQKHLRRIGVINQTTMLASETLAIAQFLKENIEALYPNSNAFANTKDTLCYATNDNQSALASTLASTNLDIAFVIGGQKSSNTTNLFRFSANSGVPTYFLEAEQDILSPSQVLHFDYQSKRSQVCDIPPLFSEARNILIILGASCPDKMAELVMERILKFQLDHQTYQTELAKLKQRLLSNV